MNKVAVRLTRTSVATCNWLGLGGYNAIYAVARGDWDVNGNSDLVFEALYGSTKVYANLTAERSVLPDNCATALIFIREEPSHHSFLRLRFLSGPIVPIDYRIFDAELRYEYALSAAHFSLDSGSTWQPAVAVSGTNTSVTCPLHQLATNADFLRNVYASNAFGASATPRSSGRTRMPKAALVLGHTRIAFRSARTLPFRLRGSQVRVCGLVSQSRRDGLRLPVGQTGFFRAISRWFWLPSSHPTHWLPAGLRRTGRR